jgi:hypothetical protein
MSHLKGHYKIYIAQYTEVAIVQSAKWLGYGLDNREIIAQCPAASKLAHGPSSPLVSRYSGHFPGDKEAGAWSWQFNSVPLLITHKAMHSIHRMPTDCTQGIIYKQFSKYANT